MTRLPRVDAVLIQAVIAGALSFAHLHDIARAAGQDGWKAWAYPISVDLLLVAAWRRIRALQETGDSARLPWCWFVVALAASLGANIATAGLLDLEAVPGWLRILVAGWPALAFFGGTLLAHAPIAEDRAEPIGGTSPPSADEAAEPVTTVERDVPELPDSTAELSDPAAPAPPATLPSVPPALVDHARKLADAHHARTGSPIDSDALRAQLGVPAPMADAIAAHLT
ncbi:DUF2637 domain-containing protein [Streptomyces marispadix]|uniref:DUF2637 domain-containing protein n=1 Tax=Streptomyces marispadix TaxID=2922868 RepID=A0ABS9SYS1_9ACTN|nr:DUF2637 domain-containing protein [Streptomyces marispadix]MCH6161425.1 DUF2637 domain-containing protein [Streptomyces marispadix]